MCCLSRASGVIVVVSGRSMVSVVFRLVRSWLICNSGFWLRLFVARFWLADVAVPLGVSCFLSCWVGGYFVARWNVGAQAGCFIAAFGHQRRRVMRARLVFYGSVASGMGANAVYKKSTFLDVSKISARRSLMRKDS